MKKERLSRRDFLKKAAANGAGLAAGTVLFEQISQLWVARAEHGGAALDLHQMLTLGAIAAQIIPTDETPGAREAGVVDYINTKLKGDAALQRIYEAGFRDVDQRSKDQFSRAFASLDASQQKSVLKSLEHTRFFEQARKDCVEGFIHSAVGKEVVGYPGGAQPHGYHDPASAPKTA
jgi:hypothetical protein